MKLPGLILTLLLLGLFLVSCGHQEIQVDPGPYKRPALTPQQLALISAHRQSNRELVEKCANSVNDNMPEIPVEYESEQLCKKPDTMSGSNVNYRLKKALDGRIDLNLTIGVTYWTKKSSPERPKEMLALAQSCIPMFKKVYDRYGINLNIIIDDANNLLEKEDKNNPKFNAFDTTVKLVEEGRSHTVNRWVIAPGVTTSSEAHCLVFLHEIGHKLGAPDEYDVRTCPDIEFISNEIYPSSIMAPSSIIAEEVDFFPRHLKTLLEPLCPGAI